MDHVQNVEKSEIFGTSGGHISKRKNRRKPDPIKAIALKSPLSNETGFSFVASREDGDTLVKSSKTCVFAIFGPILGSRP